MTAAPVNPAEIPQFTGNLAQLESDVTDLNTNAELWRSSGSDVNSTFQGLSAFYQAPEADQLFATTGPVASKSDDFATQLETVTAALDAYATEVLPLAAKLKQLKEHAATFAASVAGDHGWTKDGDKVSENNDLRHDVDVTVAAFWAAERACANKIIALVDGTTPYIADDGTHRPDMYGIGSNDLDHAQDLPWGEHVDRTYNWYNWHSVSHWVKSYVWDGFIVDGVWGTVRGLGTLVGVDGWHAMGQSWTNLAKIATSVTILTTPLAPIYLSAPSDKLPKWLRDSRTALKNTGKSLVAWDEWKKNPARAAGAVTFNVVTAVFTDGAGDAAKSGAAAKAASAAAKVSKVGRFVDPMTYVGKAGKFTVVKVSDVFKGIGGLDKVKLPDGTVEVPHRPEAPTIHLPEHGGGGVRLDPATGKLFGHDGAEIPAPKEPSAAERTAGHGIEPPDGHLSPNPAHPSPTRPPALVGAHAAPHAPDLGSHLGSEAPTGPGTHVPEGPGGTADHLPHGAHDPAHNPTASHEPPSSHNDPGTPPHTHDGSGSPSHTHDGPATPPHAHDGGGTPPPHDPGVDPHGGEADPPDGEVHYTEGDGRSIRPGGPMPASMRDAVNDALVRAKVLQENRPRILQALQSKNSEYGERIAEYIARGDFSHTENYTKLLDQVKNYREHDAVYQTMVYAEDLQHQGFDHLGFEEKRFGEGLDLDIYSKTKDGTDQYAWQLKTMSKPGKIVSNLREIADHQLRGDIPHKMAVLDIKNGLKNSLTPEILRRVQLNADRMSAVVELRFQDGSITVTPRSTTP